MKKLTVGAKAVAVACSLMMMTGCGDIVIKVQKKPKNVDLSAVQNAESLNLANSADFLKHMDNLKVIAADMLIKELANRDYRTEVRTAIRNYRKFLISRAAGEVKIDDSFYYDQANQCRKTGLNFNMDEANNFLGIILKTAVLAKLSEVSANKLNPAISKEIAAVGQLILMELGIKVEGNVDVEDVDGLTKTTGSVTIALSEISGEAIDDQTKAEDKAELITLSFTRALGANYVGTFDATIDVGHITDASTDPVTTETLEAKMAIERKNVDEKFVHTLNFNLGVKGGATNYARKMIFEQVDGQKYQVKLTDVLNPGTEDEEQFATIVDVKEGTQCKVAAGGSPDGSDDKGDEGGFVDAKDSGTDGTDGTTDGSTDGSTPPPAADGTDGSVDAKDGSVDGKDTTDGKDGGGKDGDDDPTPGKDGDGNDPGQNPGQSPHQSPHQSK